MFKFLIVLIISLSLYEYVTSKMLQKCACESDSGSKNKNNNLRLTITMAEDVKHAVFECDGKRLAYLEGAANGSSTAKVPLRFHAKCGKNVVILDDGRAAKLVGDKFFQNKVFTNRPLRDNEIFEVRLDKKIQGYSIFIGVVTESPDTIHIVGDMRDSPVASLLYQRSVFTNGTMIHHNYKNDLRKLQEGGTVGVMRTKNGTLHFFLNGVDQGPAVANIPSQVYGFVDLYFGARKISMVD